MANEDKKDFNAMLHRATDMPRIQLVTDAATVQKYGGARMYFAPAADYDAVMKRVPFGKVLTVGKIREYFARKNGADFTDPITAGIFVSISAWASAQRQTDETPYWRTLKADGELNAKYPGGAEAQRARLEAEGHTVIRRGRTNIRYYVQDYEDWNTSYYESMKKDIEISLKNLQTDYIDLYQMHNVKPAEYDTIFGEDRAYRALLEAKEAGKIKHIGITSHGLETVEKAVESGKFETIQFPYNIVENQADEVFKKAHEKGVGTIVMKPLAGGAIDDGTLAMKYILSREYIDVAIPGMDTPEQVKENTAVLENFELTEEDNVKITKIKSELGTNFCRRCEYCLPCPQGVIIPQNFLLEGYYTRYGLQDWAIDRYKALGEDQRASNCIECGACESKCPYELPIIEMLKNVVNTLEK